MNQYDIYLKVILFENNIGTFKLTLYYLDIFLRVRIVWNLQFLFSSS